MKKIQRKKIELAFVKTINEKEIIELPPWENYVDKLQEFIERQTGTNMAMVHYQLSTPSQSWAYPRATNYHITQVVSATDKPDSRILVSWYPGYRDFLGQRQFLQRFFRDLEEISSAFNLFAIFYRKNIDKFDVFNN